MPHSTHQRVSHSYAFYSQEIYRIKLPGPAILGEGKPENQNHAIIFTRGEGLQTIDMNQVYCNLLILDKGNLYPLANIIHLLG